MKKKIKDLTLEESRKICKKHKYKCYGCPLYMMKPSYYGCVVGHFKFYDYEVEVDD